MPGNLVRLCSLPKFELVSCKEDFYFNVDHLRSCDCNDGNAGDKDYSEDNFEDCHFIDGHQEEHEYSITAKECTRHRVHI